MCCKKVSITGAGNLPKIQLCVSKLPWQNVKLAKIYSVHF